MFYTVECSYTDPASEAEWNAYYSQQKLPALISVAGFITSQRFRAVTPGCPTYLALHTLEEAKVLHSEDYRSKGGGNFSRWQAYITDWQRNLYRGDGVAPALSSNKILVVSAKSIDALDATPDFRRLEMHAMGRDKSPKFRVIYLLPVEMTALLTDMPGVHLYEPLTPQLQRTSKG